jgi:hypothetical protein
MQIKIIFYIFIKLPKKKMLLNLPFEILKQIMDFLDKSSVLKLIKVIPELKSFYKDWMKSHLHRVYMKNCNGVYKWKIKYILQ